MRPLASRPGAAARFACAALAALCLLSGAVLATEPAAEPVVHDGVLESLINRVDANWLRHRALAARGDRAGAAQAARDVIELLRQENIRRLEPLAAAAVLEGRREARAGNPRGAAEAFALARAFDPGLPAAWWGEAVARLRAGDGIGTSARLALKAVQVRWATGSLRLGALVQAGTLLLFALVVAGAASVVVLLFAHGPVLVHLVEERLPRDWDPAWRRALGWVLVLAPAAVQWLGAFATLAWAAALVPAATRRERRLVYGWLILLALAVPALGAFAVLGSAPMSPVGRVAVAAAERSLRPELLAELDALAAAHPEDPLWKILAAQYLAPRYPEQAMRLLREAAAVAPGDARIRIALGNIFFRSGKREAAGALYREAVEADPGSVLALFNWARTRGMLLDTAQETELLGRAAAISAPALRALEKGVPGDDVGDVVIPVDEVTGRVFAVETRPALARAIAPANPVTLSALAALLLALVLRVRAGSYRARRCPRCGRAFCPRCSAGEDRGSETCAACVQLFQRREGLAPAARQAQARRVDEWLRTVGRGRLVAQVLWPGLALVHEGRTWSGLLQAATWVLLLAGMFLPQRVLPDTAVVHAWDPGWGFLLAALPFWILVQLPGLRPARSGRRAEA